MSLRLKVRTGPTILRSGTYGEEGPQDSHQSSTHLGGAARLPPRHFWYARERHPFERKVTIGHVLDGFCRSDCLLPPRLHRAVFCSQCGTRIGGSGNYCGGCGRQATNIGTPEQPPATVPRSFPAFEEFVRASGNPKKGDTSRWLLGGNCMGLCPIFRRNHGGYELHLQRE